MKRLILSVFITLVIIILFFTQISLKDIYILLKRINPLWAVLGSGFYIISTFFRALRFKWLIYTREIPISELFKISLLYNLSIMILPSKLGELSFPYLLNKISGRSITEGLASLIASRIYDFFILFLTLLVTSTYLQTHLQTSSFYNLVLIITSILIILMLFVYMDKILQGVLILLKILSQKRTLRNLSPLQSIQKKINEFAEDFYAIKARKTTLQVSSSSIISWIMIFLTFYSFLRGLEIKLPLLNVIFSSSLAIITSAIPLGAIGNWGMLELGWAAGFLIAGLSRQDAIASGFAVHTLIFIICLIMAIIFWFILKR